MRLTSVLALLLQTPFLFLALRVHWTVLVFSLEAQHEARRRTTGVCHSASDQSTVCAPIKHIDMFDEAESST